MHALGPGVFRGNRRRWWWQWEWVGGGGLPTRADVAAGGEKNVSTCVDGVGAINHLMINVLTLGRNQKKPPSS